MLEMALWALMHINEIRYAIPRDIYGDKLVSEIQVGNG